MKKNLFALAVADLRTSWFRHASVSNLNLSTFNCLCFLEISLSALLDKHFWKNYSG